jgi:hypothetical protein
MATVTTSGETLTPFELRLARLRELSDRDPHTARDDAWEWFAEAGNRARSDRAGAIAELDARHTLLAFFALRSELSG